MLPLILSACGKKCSRRVTSPWKPREPDMLDTSSIPFWVFLWIATASAIFIFQWKRRHTSAGLVFAYLCNFTILHWVAAAIYLRSWVGESDPEATRLGLVESTWAILALAVGSLVIAPAIIRKYRIGQSTQVDHTPHRD